MSAEWNICALAKPRKLNIYEHRVFLKQLPLSRIFHNVTN